MYWYNPTTQTSERVVAPSDDEEAIRMLAGHPDSTAFVSEYAELRCSGAPIERALVSVGHEERLREHECARMRLAAHDRPSERSSRSRAIGYGLLLAVRLREEGNDRLRKGSASGRWHDAKYHLRTSEKPSSTMLGE